MPKSLKSITVRDRVIIIFHSFEEKKNPKTVFSVCICFSMSHTYQQKRKSKNWLYFEKENLKGEGRQLSEVLPALF